MDGERHCGVADEIRQNQEFSPAQKASLSMTLDDVGPLGPSTGSISCAPTEPENRRGRMSRTPWDRRDGAAYAAKGF